MPARRREPQAQPGYLTLEEVGIILRLGKSKIRDLVRREGLPTVTFGRSIRVPINKFAAWREEQEQRSSSAGNKEPTSEQSKKEVRLC